MKRSYLSYSALKAFAKSPNHYLQYINKEHKETPAMVLGSLAHCLTLEPANFSNQFAVAPEVNKRTNSGKAVWEAFMLENPDKTIITEDQYHQATKIADAVSRHRKATRILAGKKAEQAIEGKIYGVQFKGVADALGSDAVVDLKTTQDASPDGFRRAASNFDYHLQAVIYGHLTGHLPFYWVAVESAAPYNVAVYQPTPESLDAADAYLRQLIEQFNEWDGEPVGYGENIYELDLPPWHPAMKAWNQPTAPIIDKNDTDFNSFINSL